MSVTVTVPLGIANSIDEEAQIMARGFSDALVTLVRIGIESRRVARTPVVPK